MKYDQLVFNAGIVRTFDVGNLPEGINVALGIEARQENYSIDAGEPTSYDRGPIVGGFAGSQGFPGFQPSNELDEDREAYSAYVDVEAKLTQKLLTSVALRAEDYSDFGSAVTGKVAARYDFTDAFALRGAVSTGFRAPGLQQEFFTSTATNFISGVPFEVVPGVSRESAAITWVPNHSTPKSRSTIRSARCFASAASRRPSMPIIDIDNRIVLSKTSTRRRWRR
jgi:iron complex outermembrane receptor protein